SKGRANTGFALDVDAAAALLNDTAHDREAEAGSASGRLRCVERVEDALERLGAHAVAGVVNGKHHARSVAALRMLIRIRAREYDVTRLDRELAAVRHRVACVDGE